MNNRTTYLKNLNLKNLFSSAWPAFVGLLLLTACGQEPEAPAVDAAIEVDAAKVTALEALGHKFGFTEAEFQQYEHGKHELNAKELELFDELEAKRFLATPNLPENEKEGITRMLELKKELNRRTLKAFNKPYNQVEGDKVAPIMDELYGKSEVLAAGGRQATGCWYTRKFPSGSGVGTTSRQVCSGFARIIKEGQSDCDYQYAFSNAAINGWIAVIPLTPKARQLLANPFWAPYGECRGFGGSVSRRRSGDILNSAKTDYTGDGYCLLLGKDRVDWCYNNAPGLLVPELGMGTY